MSVKNLGLSLLAAVTVGVLSQSAQAAVQAGPEQDAYCSSLPDQAQLDSGQCQDFVRRRWHRHFPRRHFPIPRGRTGGPSGGLPGRS